ncbi:MAG: ComF family protein [Betaproteobacteria bacterium]|nr:ComF family protein [Betaproteobacteria bacterium]
MEERVSAMACDMGQSAIKAPYLQLTPARSQFIMLGISLPNSCTSVLSRTLDILLPPICLLCGSPSCEPHGDGVLCSGCLADLPMLPTLCCPICLVTTTRGERCGDCLQHPPAFTKAHALYRYAFPLDRLIHALKYNAQLALANAWGRHLALALSEVAADCVLPLPLHAERIKERGFNQALEIARALARARGLKLDTDSLEKTRPTPPQTGLTLKARRKNQRGAFASSRDFSGQTLLLVDDVLTTGATCREAARILKLHGAREVHVAVVARAERHQL